MLIKKMQILIPMLKTTLLIKVLTLLKKFVGSNLMQDCKTCKTKPNCFFKKSIFKILIAKQCSTNWHKYSTCTKRWACGTKTQVQTKYRIELVEWCLASCFWMLSLLWAWGPLFLVLPFFIMDWCFYFYF